MSFVFSPVFAQAAGDAAAPAQAVQGTPSGTGAGQAAPPPDWTMPVIMVLFFAGFWFLFIRPQQKRQKEINRRQSALKNGDSVLTSAGIYGKVVGIDGERVTLQVGEGVRIAFQRQAIVGFLDDAQKSDNKS